MGTKWPALQKNRTKTRRVSSATLSFFKTNRQTDATRSHAICRRVHNNCEKFLSTSPWLCASLPLVRPSVDMKYLVFFWMHYFVTLQLEDLLTSVYKIKFWLKSVKVNGHFTRRPIRIFGSISMCSVPVRAQLYASALLMSACITQLHEPLIWEATQADMVVQQHSAFSAVKLPFKIALTALGNHVRHALQLLSTVVLAQFSGQDTAVLLILL